MYPAQPVCLAKNNGGCGIPSWIQCFSVFTVITAALWVVSYSIMTVVDLACDAMLQAAYGQDSCQPARYAISNLPVGHDPCQPSQ